MLHLYEVKAMDDHFWEVYQNDAIIPWSDNFVEYVDDSEFVSYNANLMSQGVDFVVHFYDEDVDEYHLVLEPQRLVKI